MPSDASVGEDAAAMCLASSLTYPQRVTSATRSPDGKGFCCEPGPVSCHGGFFGGFVDEVCKCGMIGNAGIIDLAPPDWIPETDEHGCATYRRRLTQTACCNCPRDSGLDCSALDARYKFSLAGGPSGNHDVYTVSGDRMVEREQLRGEYMDAGSFTCRGSLSACGANALDVTDFTRAFREASEEWWGDGSTTIGGDQRPHDQMLVIERSSDGKKLLVGKPCGNDGSCSVALVMFHDLFNRLRTEIALADQTDGGSGSTCGRQEVTGPTCTPGADQTCNDDPAISSLHGHCESDGSCTCAAPFGKNPATGKCL